MKKINFRKLKNINKKFNFKKIINFYNTKTLVLSLIMLLGILVATITLIFALFIIITAPDFKKERLYQKESTIIYDLNGAELARIGKSNLTQITYDDLPEVLIDAIIATEDSRYFQHTGLDAARFLKASVGQLLGANYSGGASTITMQVVKNTYTDNSSEGLRGIIRKFTDIYMAIFKLENAYTKEEIVEFYFNSQWLGYDGNINYSGITGVEQGSEFYFGKSVSDLTLAEASLIAGMFQNPVAYNPYKFPEKAKERQNIVLKLMVRHGYITEEEKNDVLEIPVQSLLKNNQVIKDNSNQAAIDYILNEAEEITGKNPYTVPMKIYSTIDTDAQKILTDLENGTIYTINEARGNLQFGVAITNVENGSIAALSGGKNYQAKGNNRAIAKRQPGSTAKVLFDYGPYIEYLNGSTYSLFLDEPTSYSSGGTISNYDNRYKGLLTMREALVDSRNVPAFRAFKAVAKQDENLIKDFVHSLGINYGRDLYESASIGGFDGISPLELSAAYGAFGRGGYYIKPYSITKINFIENDKTENFKYTKERVMSEETAYLITNILVSAGNEAVAGFRIPGSEIAEKTGTTTIDNSSAKSLGLPYNATMDSWTITYSSKYSTGIWIGYDKLSKTNYLTSGIASPIRRGISKAVGTKLYKKGSSFKKPSGVIAVEVEKETFPALQPSPFTPSNMIITEYFKKGTEPAEISNRYSSLDNPTNLKANYIDGNIIIKWDQIKTPDAIDANYLINHFNTYYDNHATKYYEQRIAYNNQYIGTLGYQIYLDTNGSLTSLGRIENENTFTYSPPSTGNFKFVVKSAYSIFKNNISSGASVTINTEALADIIPE